MSLALCTARGQSGFEKGATIPTIRTTTNLVIAPVVVRSKAGKIIRGLRPDDFVLTDNGVEQKLFADEVTKQHLAIVVIIQTGAGAPRGFQNYRTFGSMLEVTANRATRKVALITFDSQPRQIWNFPPRTDGLEYAFEHLDSGDPGAAIIDAVNSGIDLLQQQPPTLGRVILILSQAQDSGSSTPPAAIIQRLGENNVAVYSVTFPTESPAASESLNTCSAHEGQAPGGVTSASMPSVDILKRICQETATQLAKLSGGEHVRIENKDDLIGSLSLLREGFSNSVLLSFHPEPNTVGFHAISVTTRSSSSHFVVSSRSSYWVPKQALFR
ncbi:VWA domain-containing protein [Edaphobacter modestus]|nr:VWA domain-containing protein [Edaphobacter modestus]